MNALIIVDVQYDFLPGGSLAVKDGDQIIPLINKLQPYFDLVVATQDWHPAEHKSFAANHEGKEPGEAIELDGLQQVLWPVHCVQDSEGARLSDDLDQWKIDKVIFKGTNPMIDSYSGFFDNGKKQATELEEYLRSKNVQGVCVVGLAADYCVKFTAIDSVQLGFRTYVMSDATKAVNLNPGDYERSLAEMQEAGVFVIESKSFLN